jgi:hypothetical protein
MIGGETTIEIGDAMTTPVPDEVDEVPEASDPLAGSILPVIEAIFAATHEGSSERSAAMGELMLVFSPNAAIDASYAG